MLQKLHEKIKGWVAAVIIAAISATFVLWGVQYYLQSSGANNTTVVKINDKKITLQELTANVQQLQHQVMMQTGHVLSDGQNLELKQYALQNLILSNVLLQTAQQAGFNVGPDQVDALITSLPQFQENGQFSPLRYQQVLYANSLTPYAFKVQVANGLTTHQIESGIQETAFVLPNEVKQDDALMHQQRSFGYVIVPQTRFIHSVKVTPSMLAAYYQQHRAEFKSPEKVSIEYVELSPSVIGASLNVTDAEIKQYYQDNVATYRAQKKALATVMPEIKKILLQQKINAVLTKDSDRLSDIAYTNPTTLKPAADALHLPLQTSPLFSQSGGTQGISAEPQVVAAAFGDNVLGQGNNSDPIELKDGRVIVLRIKAHQPSRVLSLAEMTPSIEKIMQQQMAQAQAALVADKMANAISNHQAPVKAIAPYQLTWQQPTSVSRDNKLISSSIINTVFALRKNNAVTTVALANGDSAVVQLTAIKPGDSKQPSAKNLQAIQQKLLSGSGQMEYQLYVRSARAHAKIKMMAAATANPKN